MRRADLRAKQMSPQLISTVKEYIQQSQREKTCPRADLMAMILRMLALHRISETLMILDGLPRISFRDRMRTLIKCRDGASAVKGSLTASEIRPLSNEK